MVKFNSIGNKLGVAGLVGVNLLVRRVFHRAAGIAAGHVGNAGQKLERSVQAPETAAAEDNGAGSFRE